MGSAAPKWTLNEFNVKLEVTTNGDYYLEEASTSAHLVSGELTVTMLDTHHNEALDSLATRLSLSDGDTVELDARVVRGAEGSEFPRNIIVTVNDQPVGRVHHEEYQKLRRLSENDSLRATLRIEIRDRTHDHTRASGAIWLGNGTPEWSDKTLEPWRTYLDRCAAERAKERQRERSKVQQSLITPESLTARALTNGTLPAGADPHDLLSAIQELKRQNRYEEALRLLHAGLEASKHRPDAPTAWFTEHAAICHRRLKQRDQEIEVLEHFLKSPSPNENYNQKLRSRLEKLLN